MLAGASYFVISAFVAYFSFLEWIRVCSVSASATRFMVQTDNMAAREVGYSRRPGGWGLCCKNGKTDGDAPNVRGASAGPSLGMGVRLNPPFLTD